MIRIIIPVTVTSNVRITAAVFLLRLYFGVLWPVSDHGLGFALSNLDMASSDQRLKRCVRWVSYSKCEAKSGLPFMKAIVRPSRSGAVHWQLRPVVDCIEPGRPGWLMQRGLPLGVGGHQEEFELPLTYPWFIESRRALQHQLKMNEADGGSTSASPDPFSEQFFCASSAGLLGILLVWEKTKKNPQKEIAVSILEDWLGKCLHDVKLNGMKESHWHPPPDPPACGAGASHGGIRDGGYCTVVWELISALWPREGRISLDETCRLLRALHDQSHMCGVMRCWRNKLMGEVAVLLQKSLVKLPFVRKPGEAIVDWHLARGTKRKLKDIDEDLDENIDSDSEHISPTPKLGRKKASNLNIALKTHTYAIETCRKFAGKRKLSISFDESILGRENTLTAILSSHEADISAWLIPQVTASPPLFVCFSRSHTMYERASTAPPPPLLRSTLA